MVDEKELLSEFKLYAQRNNLDFEIEIQSLIYEKPSDSYSFFKLFVEQSLKKQNNTFDVYFYDTKYTNLYGPYLLDIQDKLPKEYIELFNSKIINEECIYKDKTKNEEKLVGLPMCMSFEVLYSNKLLLSKHSRPVPKTWAELIDTCKYIMEQEKEDSELICFNGLFDDSEQGLLSLYEFIYSCRDSYNSTYPNIQDQSFINSLNMLQKLKNEIDKENNFNSNENFTFQKLISGKAIFLKYWFIAEPFYSTYVIPQYYLSTVPGLKEGISGSMCFGDIIGAVKNIAEEKKDAVLEVIKYFSSKEYQIGAFNNGMCSTALTELMENKEIYKDAPCDLVKEIQFTGEPSFIQNQNKPEDFRKKYRNYIYQFLYENKTMEETLKKFDDITKYYYISLSTENSYAGFISFILMSVISLLMLLSLIFLFNDNFSPFFKFLPTDFWIITVLGSIVILWVPIISYGRIDTLKCHLKPLLLCIGYTLYICPTLYKLISQFPEEYKITEWVNKHRYMFLLLNILIDILLCSISLINPYTPNSILAENGEKFEICKYNGEYSIIIVLAYKLLIILLLLFLIFVEWNLSDTLYDLKFIILTQYISIFSILFITVIYFIKIKYYITYFIIQTVNIFIISIANYIIIYGFRLCLAFLKKQNVKLQFISNINEKFINNESQMQAQTKSYSKTINNDNIYKSNAMDDDEEYNNINTSNPRASFISRMINYHYTTESYNISNSSKNTTSDSSN